MVSSLRLHLQEFYISKKMAAYAPASSNSMSWVRALHRYRKGLNSDDEFFAFISSFIGSNIWKTYFII